MFQFSQSSLRNREGVDQRLIEISDKALSITVVDFGIPSSGGLRTAKEQKALYDAGKSKLDGTFNRSRHQEGRALDFYAYVHGEASWEPEHLAVVAAAFLQSAAFLGYKLKWGGLWRSFQDMPHVELVD